jgi:MFS family permease
MSKIMDNKKTNSFFYLILLDFIVATQVVAISVFFEKLITTSDNWTNKIFIIFLLVVFLVFLFFSRIIKGNHRANIILRLGLVFIFLGSLINLFLDNPAFFVFGIIICGLGAGMIIAGQIGIIWHKDAKKNKAFSLAIMTSLVLGLTIGSIFINFLSGPMLSALQVSFLLGIAFPILAMFEKITLSFEILLKKIAGFFSSHWKKISAFGFYHIISWLFDNPLWLFVELKWHSGGVYAMMLAALTINFAMLFYYRKNKVSWLGLDVAVDFMQKKTEKLTQVFFILVSPKMLVVFVVAALLSPDYLLVLQVVFYFLVAFEILILATRGLGTKWESIVAFFALSVWQDSFITTAYLRRKDYSAGLKRKDYIIFFLSSLTSISYWAIRNSLIAELILRPIF